MRKINYDITMHKATLKSVEINGTEVRVVLKVGNSETVIVADTQTEKIFVNI